MSLMSEEQALERLGSPENVLNRLSSINPQVELTPESNVEFRKIRNPRKRARLSQEERTALGVAATILGPTEAARQFDVDPATAMAARNGATAHNRRVDPDVKAAVDGRLETIRTSAIDKLVDSLNGLTKEKLEKERPATLSRIAVDMATVIDKVTPKEREEGNVKVHLYIPESRDERDYETIDIRAKVVDVERGGAD